MPTGVNFYSSEPLRIQPRIIRQPPDPLELAIKQAQLYNLQQEPDIRRRQLKLQELGLTESGRHNVADETLGQAQLANTTKYQSGTLAESVRHNVADESVAQGNLAETTRFHTATIDDANKQREAGLTQSLIAHLTPLVVGTPGFDVNTLAETLKSRGLHEVADAITTTKAQHVSDKVDQLNTNIGAAKGNQKVISALVNNAKNDPDWKYIKQHLPPEIDTTKELKSPESAIKRLVKSLYGSPQLPPF